VIGLGLVPTVLGLLAVILGVVGVRRVGKRIATNRGVSIVGIVLGVIGLIASVALTISVAAATAYFAPTIEQAQQCFQQAQGNPLALQQCQQQFSGQISNIPGVTDQQPDGG
jgi:predicted PurR-regulated permease PerM